MNEIISNPVVFIFLLGYFILTGYFIINIVIPVTIIFIYIKLVETFDFKPSMFIVNLLEKYINYFKNICEVKE